MIGGVVQHVLRFFFLIFLQVVLLNNIAFFEVLNPYLYVLFILSLPIETSGWLTLTLAFLMGITLDMFTYTFGMHTLALVFMGFCRVVLLKFISPREGYEFGTRASFFDMGWSWYLTYSGILILLHHSYLFFIESFGSVSVGYTLIKILGSSILTLILVVFSHIIGSKPKASNQ